MKPVTITLYVFEGDRLVNIYEDHVHDTIFNVTTIHVPNMIRAINPTITMAQDIRQIIIEGQG